MLYVLLLFEVVRREVGGVWDVKILIVSIRWLLDVSLCYECF